MTDRPIRFRSIEEDDLEVLTALYVDIFAAPPWHEAWPPAAAHDRLAETLGTPGFFGLLAYSGTACLGFVVGFAETHLDGSDFYVKEMCVAAGRQRQGLGTSLLAELEQAVARRGARKAYLLTARDSTAETFYKANGYYVSDKMVMMGHWLRPRE